MVNSRIDRVKIWNRISEDAEDLLEGKVTEMSFEIFANKCIEILDVEFDEYIFSKEKEIGDQLNGEVQKSFLNFSTGYLSKMRKWIEDNPITKTKMELEVADETPKTIDSEPGFVKKVWVWIVNIFKKVWEFIREFFNKLFAKENLDNKDDNSCEKVFVKDQFKQKVHEDLDAWLDLAEEKSDAVIASFVSMN